jgi:hypothetical protein
VLENGFECDEDLDLVRDSALSGLLQFPNLPDRAVDIMQAMLADEDDSDLVLTRKMAACGVLAQMGLQANLC